VPGSGTLNKGGDANVSSVSCGSAGNCAAGGFYTGSSSRQAFLVSEQNGVWRKAVQVPGLASLNAGGFGGVTSVSCVSSGHCAAAGVYSNRPVHLQSFVVSQR
jgi:hypothetical protein